MGLRWIQREISSFGGDKDRVTIMGHSAGGIAADLLSLSPETVGLFHQLISMSGPAGMGILGPGNLLQHPHRGSLHQTSAFFVNTVLYGDFATFFSNLLAIEFDI